MDINLTKSSRKERYFIIYSYLIISTDQNHKCDPSLQHSKAVNEGRGGTKWPTIAQNLRSICFQAFLGAFFPHAQGVPVIPYVQRVQNMYGKGG